MTNLTRIKGFATIAQLIIVVVALLGVGTLYLTQTVNKEVDTDATPRDEEGVIEKIIVTDENFSELFYSLKRIDEVAVVYSPEEVIREAAGLHNRFIEIQGTVTMAARQPPEMQQPGDPVWMPAIGPAFVTSSGTIVLNGHGNLQSVGLPGFEQFALRGILRVSQANGVPTEYYFAIPPLCENCVTVLRPQTNNASCTTDANCKLIYSSCDCEAVSVRDPRTELPSTIMCIQNNCTNGQQAARAVCENRICRVKTTNSPSPASSLSILKEEGSGPRIVTVMGPAAPVAAGSLVAIRVVITPSWDIANVTLTPVFSAIYPGRDYLPAAIETPPQTLTNLHARETVVRSFKVRIPASPRDARYAFSIWSEASESTGTYIVVGNPPPVDYLPPQITCTDTQGHLIECPVPVPISR